MSLYVENVYSFSHGEECFVAPEQVCIIRIYSMFQAVSDHGVMVVVCEKDVLCGIIDRWEGLLPFVL